MTENRRQLHIIFVKFAFWASEARSKPHWDEMLDPDPHWNQYGSTTMIADTALFVETYVRYRTGTCLLEPPFFVNLTNIICKGVTISAKIIYQTKTNLCVKVLNETANFYFWFYSSPKCSDWSDSGPK